MDKYLIEVLKKSGDLSLEQVALHMGAAVIIGAVIVVSYYITHAGTIYSRKFNVSLLILTVLTTTVMTVIGNNVALSLGLVGALSIIRFRTPVKDSRDTVYIFWTVTVGICCGIGDYTVAAMGSAAVFVVLLFFGRMKNDGRVLLIIRGVRDNERKIEGVVFDYYDRKAQLRVKNTTEASVELIYELTRKMMEKQAAKEDSITEALYAVGSVEYVNLVAQNDEVNN